MNVNLYNYVWPCANIDLEHLRYMIYKYAPHLHVDHLVTCDTQLVHLIRWYGCNTAIDGALFMCNLKSSVVDVLMSI
jgi:hypothetical protein